MLESVSGMDVVVIGTTTGNRTNAFVNVDEVLRVPPNIRLSNQVPLPYGTDATGDRMLYAYSLTEPKAFSLYDLDQLPEVEKLFREYLIGN